MTEAYYGFQSILNVTTSGYIYPWKYYEKSNGTMSRLDYVHSLATLLLRAPVALAAVMFSSCAFGQITLSLSPGSASPGSAVVLNLSMGDPSNTQPASLQWVMTYPTSDFSGVTVAAGSATTAAGKSLSCNNVAGTS